MGPGDSLVLVLVLAPVGGWLLLRHDFYNGPVIDETNSPGSETCLAETAQSKKKERDSRSYLD